MKKVKNLFASAVFVFIFGVIFNASVSGQLLINEILADPGDQQNDSCQYIELRGTPGQTVAANTYFVAIESDGGFPGLLHVAVNIGGRVVGSNGTITLVNLFGLPCPRTYPAGTTVVNYNSPLRIGGANLSVGSESFAILQTDTPLSPGQDRDPEDDGTLNFTATFIDAVAFLVNPDEQFAYPANSPVIGTPFQDVPDAIVRFANNNTPFSAAAYYFGELETSPETATGFIGPFSSNFPAGGTLTPGGSNAPVGVARSRADFDADGRTDLSVYRPSDGNWYLRLSTAGFLTLRWGEINDVLIPGDYDGDGKADTATFRALPGLAPDFYILNSNGFVFNLISYGEPGDEPVVGDYNGDGRTDIAVYRPSNNTWYIKRSDLSFKQTPLGAAGDLTVPADYDGDGLTDIAMYRPTTGQWFVRNSGGPFNVVPWGIAGDEPVHADYDGDNKEDFAVFRPSEGRWYIWGTLAGQYTVNWGIAGDVLVPGDYDGDGKDDPAVYRNGIWFLNQSAAGFRSEMWGMGSDIPVPSAYIP